MMRYHGWFARSRRGCAGRVRHWLVMSLHTPANGRAVVLVSCASSRPKARTRYGLTLGQAVGLESEFLPLSDGRPFVPPAPHRRRRPVPKRPLTSRTRGSRLRFERMGVASVAPDLLAPYPSSPPTSGTFFVPAYLSRRFVACARLVASAIAGNVPRWRAIGRSRRRRVQVLP